MKTPRKEKESKLDQPAAETVRKCDFLREGRYFMRIAGTIPFYGSPFDSFKQRRILDHIFGPEGDSSISILRLSRKVGWTTTRTKLCLSDLASRVMAYNRILRNYYGDLMN